MIGKMYFLKIFSVASFMFQPANKGFFDLQHLYLGGKAAKSAVNISIRVKERETMRLGLLFFSISVLFLSACSKDDNTSDDNTPQTTKKELLTTKPWKYAAWTVRPPVQDGNGNYISDVYAYKPACEKDDEFVFNANGNVNFNQGATKCDPNQPQTTYGSWAFKNDETELVIGGRVHKINTLNSIEMKVTFEDVVGSTTHTHYVAFKH